MKAPPNALANIQAINPYVPGKPIDELKREFGLTDIVKLASNENPFGVSPKAQAAVNKALGESSRYPDGNGFNLKQKLVEHFKLHGDFWLNTNQMVLGNGSNDVLSLAARVFLSAGDKAVMSEYSFAIYPLLVQGINAKNVVVPTKNFVQDLPRMMSAVKESQAKVVFLANPNNPTGVWTPMNEVKAWIESIPSQCIIILDEAYTEFLDVANAAEANVSLSWLEEHPNLVITRTFSKIYGLGGMRVGYALTHSSIADWMNRLRQPFNVNHLALVAACATLDDAEFIENTRRNNLTEMQVIECGLQNLGLTTIPSCANFITFKVPNADMVNLAMLKEGVIIRSLSSYGMPNYVRVSIGLPEENMRFLKALKKSI